jgi:hypothetical protein
MFEHSNQGAVEASFQPRPRPVVASVKNCKVPLFFVYATAHKPYSETAHFTHRRYMDLQELARQEASIEIVRT